MKNKLLIKRALLLLIFISLAFTGLGYRLVDLQVLRHDEFAKLEDENSLRAYWQAPRRGQIVDINNNPLATGRRSISNVAMPNSPAVRNAFCPSPMFQKAIGKANRTSSAVPL